MRTRKAWLIVLVTFVMTTGCETDENKAATKTDTSLTTTAQETGVEESVQTKEQQQIVLEEKPVESEITEQALQPAQEEAGTVMQAPETAEAEKVSGAETAVNARYIGARKCKACHLKQFKSWEKTKMAMSYENLKPGVKAEAKKKAGLAPSKDYTVDKDCLRCHTTGYGKPGGFTSFEETPKFINVQCEACHGPGSEYSRIMKKNKTFKLAEVKAVGLIVPKEDTHTCMECHSDESPFHDKVDPQYKFEIQDRLQNTHEHFPLKYKH